MFQGGGMERLSSQMDQKGNFFGALSESKLTLNLGKIAEIEYSNQARFWE